MSRYRKVDPRIWNDGKFRCLSNRGKLAFFFLLTHPHMTAIGAMRASLPGLAAEIGWTPEAFGEAFADISQKGMSMHDEKASLIWLPNFLRYNPPESPNVIKAWIHSLDLLPECGLLNRVLAASVAFARAMNKGFAEALPEAFAKGMPYQELELEPKQEQEQDNPSPAAPASQSPPTEKPRRENKPKADEIDTGETWDAYSVAYFDRYGTEPVRNAKVNSAIKGFVQRVGTKEAPDIARFFVAHNDSFYARKCHDAGQLLADAEKLRTEWATGQTMSATRAMQIDRTSANLASHNGALELLKAKGLA